MDPISGLLSLQFLVLCLALSALIFAIRRLVEFRFNTFTKGTLWRDLILPLLPLVLGTLIPLAAPMLPVPEGFASTSGRVLFGLTAGFLSGFVYRWVKAAFHAKVGSHE